MLGALIYWLLYALVRIPVLLGWWRWRLVGRENLPPREAGGMVLVMNHVHWLDIPIVGDLLPIEYRLSWLAKSELFRNPIVGWWLHVMSVIPIRRGQRDVAAMDAVVKALQAGAVLLIYPEGTRSHSGVLQEGRGGAVRMALQAGVPIVPIAITGTEHGVRGSLVGRPVVVTVGKPYMVDPLPDKVIPPALMDQLTADMMVRIAALLPPERRGIYAPLLEAPAAQG